jgi:hypothetical protein
VYRKLGIRSRGAPGTPGRGDRLRPATWLVPRAGVVCRSGCPPISPERDRSYRPLHPLMKEGAT